LGVGGYVYYKKNIREPYENEAHIELFKAEHYFRLDSFEVALKGKEGIFTGFVQIAEDYSGTQAGNLALYYAGISNLHLGKYEEAISYLEKYDGEDAILSAMVY